MIKALRGALIGTIFFFMVYTVCNSLLTGTDTVSSIMSLLIPLATGFGVIIYVLYTAFKGGGEGGGD